MCLYSVSPPLHLWVCPQIIFQPCFRFTERATEEEDLPNMGRSKRVAARRRGFLPPPTGKYFNKEIAHKISCFFCASVFVFCYLIGENEWKNDSNVRERLWHPVILYVIEILL